jgi:ATP-dependent helicase/DNAse subunit B
MLSGDKLPASISNHISITKTTQNLDLIVKKLITNDKYSGLSPSALNTYKDCSLRFFFRYGAGIKETNDVEENAEASTQGQILHKSLEILLTPFKGKILNEADIISCQTKTEETINLVFQEFFSQKESNFGKNFLQKKVTNEYVKKLLLNDLHSIKQSRLTNHYLSLIDLEVLLETTVNVMINEQSTPIYN